jgi:hypothetical protein
MGGGVRSGTGIWTTVNHRAINCFVIDVESDFAFSIGYTFPEVNRCYVDGCGTAAYYEPGSGGTVTNPDFQQVFTVRNSTFTNVICGVVAAFFYNTANMAGLTVENNSFSFVPTILRGGMYHYYSAVQVHSEVTTSFVQNMIVRNNVIKLCTDAQAPLQGYGICLVNCNNTIVERNLINLEMCPAVITNSNPNLYTIGNCRGLVYDPNTVTWTTLRENRDVFGSLLGVRKSDDTAAPRQQTP